VQSPDASAADRHEREADALMDSMQRQLAEDAAPGLEGEPGEETSSIDAVTGKTIIVPDRSAASIRYRVTWGLGRSEDFDSPDEAAARADEIHAEMIEAWPLLSGTSDGSLPRVIGVRDDA